LKIHKLGNTKISIENQGKEMRAILLFVILTEGNYQSTNSTEHPLTPSNSRFSFE